MPLQTSKASAGTTRARAGARSSEEGRQVSESIAEGVSIAVLVVGFPLLLLTLMLSLEKLESWGLRQTTPVEGGPAGERDDHLVDAAVDAVEAIAAAGPVMGGPAAADGRPTRTTAPSGGATVSTAATPDAADPAVVGARDADRPG